MACRLRRYLAPGQSWKPSYSNRTGRSAFPVCVISKMSKPNQAGLWPCALAPDEQRGSVTAWYGFWYGLNLKNPPYLPGLVRWYGFLPPCGVVPPNYGCRANYAVSECSATCRPAAAGSKRFFSLQPLRGYEFCRRGVRQNSGRSSCRTALCG